jgi:hypothetical protein
LPLAPETVEACLNGRKPLDAVFRKAFRRTLASIPRDLRPPALAGITGHVAESVVEVVLQELGYLSLWHLVAPGGHGIDLAMLTPATDRVVVFEVKGTLRPRGWPRLRKTELMQLSTAWIDKHDNPGMAELEMTSEDVYAGFAIVQFADRSCRFGLSADFENLHPVEAIAQLVDVEWLDGQPRRGSDSRDQ